MAVTISTIGYTGWQTHKVLLTGESTRGKPGLQLIGFPSQVSTQLKSLIPTACKVQGISLPARKIAITIQPSISKVAHLYSLSFPVAVLLLALANHIPIPSCNRVFVGEVTLDGSLTAPMPLESYLAAARALGCTDLTIPQAVLSSLFSYLSTNLKISCPTTLLDFCTHERLNQSHPLLNIAPTILPKRIAEPGFESIRGRWQVKRALTLAVAGRHHTLLVGPPGVGKTQIALVAQTLQPDLTPPEQVTNSTLSALAGEPKAASVQSPFRTPTHRSSLTQLLGSGITATPGEISLANAGILFLDELSEFSNSVLAGLRQPMETGTVPVLSNSTYPASATIIAVTNPCRCNQKQQDKDVCSCDKSNLAYRRKLGGALLDRFGLHCILTPNKATELITFPPDKYSTTDLQSHILSARQRQHERYHSLPWQTNGWASAHYLLDHCLKNSETKEYYMLVTKKHSGSVRWHRHLLSIARTIADLESNPIVLPDHIAEALQYRPELEY